MHNRIITVLASSLLLSTVAMAMQEPDAGAAPIPSVGRTATCSIELGAPPSVVFRGFTTAEGIKRSWSVAQARVDFRVGGQIRTRYRAEGDLDDPTSIVNTILAFEPDHMLAIKATAPEGAPPWLQRICETGWSVLRLEPVGDDGQRTRLTLTGMGYGEGPEYDTAYDFFQKGNQWTLDQMKKLYPINDAPRADSEPAALNVIELDRFVAAGPVPVDLSKTVTVDAPAGAVFSAFASREGLKAFLKIESSVDLRIGGPMEMYFGPNLPPGQRGSDGCQILSYIPDRMLSFSWNAPPQFPAEREKRTWVVIHFTPADGGGTTVQLQHLGFGPSGEGHWDEIRAYFDRAWGNVLKALQAHFAQPNTAAGGTNQP